jgi:hypothetical protein
MEGDKHKPKPVFFRWIDAFMDGLKAPIKGHYRVPSQTDDKKYARKWRRRKEKKELDNNE